MGGIAGVWSLQELKGVQEFCDELVSKIQQEELHTVSFEKGQGKDEWTQTLLFGNNFLTAMWLMDYGPQKFTSGEEFKHKDLSGSDSRSVITVENHKVTQVQKIGQGEDGIVELTIEREFKGNEMTTTLSFTGGENKCVCKFLKNEKE